jgi:glycosyltransferase involved in cell wall biosynthesis
MPDPTPLISVVICTRNRPQDIALCLPTVLACEYAHFEVVLVDQSTDDGTAAQMPAFQAQFPALNYLPSTTVGKTAALDIGIAQAQGEILAFTDDDCEVTVGWLRQIAEEFAAAPDADILFGPVLPSPALDGMTDICVPSWSFADARPLRRDEVCGMGANMALRRRTLERLSSVTLFDPALGPGAPFPAGEEGDFVYRLRRAGAVAALRPSLLLYHRAFRTPERWGSVLHGYGMGDAAFHAKHARSGDGWAMRTIGHTLLRNGVRSLAKAVMGRGGSEWNYLRGYCLGLSRSRRFPVDRRERMYALPAARPRI